MSLSYTTIQFLCLTNQDTKGERHALQKKTKKKNPQRLPQLSAEEQTQVHTKVQKATSSSTATMDAAVPHAAGSVPNICRVKGGVCRNPGSSLDGVGLETERSPSSTGGRSQTDYGLSYLRGVPRLLKRPRKGCVPTRKKKVTYSVPSFTAKL